MSKNLNLVESGFGKKTFNRIIRAINRNRVIVTRPGWEQTAEGVLPPPSVEAGGGAGLFPWGLYKSPEAEDGEWSIQLGRILLQYADLEVDFAIDLDASASPMIPADEGVVFLEIEAGATTATLKYGTTWSGYPKAYEATYDDTTFNVDHVAYRFPLWYFTSTKVDRNSVSIGAAVYGNQMIYTHLTLSHAIHRYSEPPVVGEGPAYRVPFLTPSHGPISRPVVE